MLLWYMEFITVIKYNDTDKDDNDITFLIITILWVPLGSEPLYIYIMFSLVLAENIKPNIIMCHYIRNY